MDELLEVAVIDDGAVLFESLVRPVRATSWPEAQAIHGISPEDVKNAPDLATLLPVLTDVLVGDGLVVAYNAPFDLGFLPAQLRSQVESSFVCAMEAFSLHRGEWDEAREDYRRVSLASAASIAEHSWTSSPHRARADAEAVRSVWRWLSRQHAETIALP